MNRLVSRVVVLGLLAGSAWLGCKGGKEGTETRVRLVHASPDLPKSDVDVVGISSELFSAVEYGGTTDYRAIAPGTFEFVLRASALGGVSPALVTSEPIEIAEGASITLVAAGFLLSDEPDDSLRVLAFDDAFAAPAEGARARFVHAISNAGPLLLEVGDDGDAELGPVERFAATPPEGFELAAGAPVHVSLLAGTPPVPVGGFTVPQLEQGETYYLVATGVGALDELRGPALIVSGDAGTVEFIEQDPRVYLLHASPDAPALDVFAGDEEVADDLAFGELSGPIPLAPGSVELDFFVHEAGAARPAGAPAAAAVTGELSAGDTYLLVATGFVGEGRSPAFELVTVEDEFRPFNPLLARLRALHASPGTTTLTLGAVTEGGRVLPLPGLGALAYLQASAPEGAELPPLELRMGLVPIGESETAAKFEIDSQAGLRAIGVIAGVRAPSGSEPPLQMILVDTSQSPWTAAPLVNER